MTDDELSIQRALGLISAVEEDTLATEERTRRFAAALRRMREDQHEAARIDRIVEANRQATVDVTEPPVEISAPRPDPERAPTDFDPTQAEPSYTFESISDAKVLIVSVAARLAGMHPQTLRQYARMGLVLPGRSPSGGYRYSDRDVAILREIQRLSKEEGLNLAGIKRIIELTGLIGDLRQRTADLEDEIIRTRARLARLEAVEFRRVSGTPSDQIQTGVQPSGR